MLTGVRRSPSSRAAVAAVVVLGVLALAGCGGELGAPEPATEQGERVIDLWRALLIAATVLGLVVVVLAGIAVVRYRERRGQEDDPLPPQRHGSVALEAVYIAVPLLVVAGFFAYTLYIDDLVRDDEADADVVVEVTGYRWGWRFEYPDEGVLVESIAGQVPEIVLPVDQTVRFVLTSDDVIHSFFVPAFLTKRDALPSDPRDTGRLVDGEADATTSFSVRTTRTGEFLGHCAEFCGLDHARMNFTVVVAEADEYERWVAEAREAA